MQLLPHSLTSIRVFDAAARYLSCTRAAEELFLTQSAVSKQLHSLEEHLGVTLFNRIHQGLVLTDAGRQYWESVRPALAMLADATLRVRALQVDHNTVNLGVPPTLGQKWLIPRLAEFNALHPDITVRFSPRLANDALSSALTAEICFGRGNWPGMKVHYLLGHELYPVCSPTLLKQLPVKAPADFLRHRLMEHIQLPDMWERLFAENKVTGYDPRRMQQYEQFSVMIPALLAGLGIGLMPRFLVEDELRKRKLVIVSRTPILTEYGYYFVYPKKEQPSPGLTCFSAWLMDKVAHTKT